MKACELELDLGTVTMNCTTEEVTTTLAALLREMRSVIPLLRPDERDSLRQIMVHPSQSLTVAEVFPDFTRESEGHKTLRRLRAAQFVRPAATGRWSPDERIEVKPFARLMWDHVGEDAIFAGLPQRRTTAAAVAAVAPPEEIVDLALEDDRNEREPVAERNGYEPAAEEPPADDEVNPLDVEAAKEARQQPVAEEREEQPAAEDEVVDLQDVEEVEPEEPAVAKAGTSGFEDDNVLDPNEDELFAFAQEELRKGS